MQRELYISCIKINGIPLLAPLMSDSIKEEMGHYRSLAVKTEEKLKARRVAKSKSKRTDTIESINETNGIKYCLDSDVSSYNTRSDTNNSNSCSEITIVDHVSTTLVAKETKDDNESSISSVHYSEVGSNLTNETVNDSESVRFKQDECVNVAEAITPNENTISAESSKVEVPKTLDIVPITLSNDKDNARLKENESLPKLSRQGSYILDTPSPILVACMNAELTDKDYVPTPTIINSSQEKKQWNIMQPKVEWVNEQLAAEEINAPNKSESTMQESNTQYIKSDIVTEPYQTNKSTSHTGVTIPKEHTCKSDPTLTEYNHKSNIDLENENVSDRSKKDILDTTSELQRPMENSPEAQALHTNVNKHCDKMEITKEYQDLFVKAMSPITSDKLLTVYKEIEEMHKKQMTELIDRQQKEQLSLQSEFQRQQTLLLDEIQKCSSRISYRINPPNVTADQLVLSDEQRLEDTINRTQQLNVNSPDGLHVETYNKLPSSNYMDVIVCPLDYISSKNLHLPKRYKLPPYITAADNSSTSFNLDFTKRINLYDVHNNSDNDNNNNNSNNNNDNDNDSSSCESYDRTICKNSTVNRQLFPLVGNTTHMPVMDTAVYQDEHVQAVNIINAYTRGYLVRRLMQTERVITLKKIYKEALQCMLKLHVDAPLNLAEVNFLHRLQLQCDAASMNLVELFAQSPVKRMIVIAQDHEIKQSRIERPTSSRSYSFATQKTLARKSVREFESTTTKYQRPLVRKNIARSRCQTWTSDMRERLSPKLNQSIRRSTSTGTVRKPWR